MSRLKLKQVLSNLSFNESNSRLTLSGSGVNTDFVLSGSMEIVSTLSKTGSLTIKDIDSFGDSGSFYTVDLGDY
jgi:hypothetical protein